MIAQFSWSPGSAYLSLTKRAHGQGAVAILRSYIAALFHPRGPGRRMGGSSPATEVTGP